MGGLWLLYRILLSLLLCLVHIKLIYLSDECSVVFHIGNSVFHLLRMLAKIGISVAETVLTGDIWQLHLCGVLKDF